MYIDKNTQSQESKRAEFTSWACMQLTLCVTLKLASIQSQGIGTLGLFC